MKDFFGRNQLKIVIAISSLLSLMGFIYYYQNGLGLAYNDSMAHLDIARQVVDNMEPGVYQLGSVWLPLNHVLTLLLVWNDWAWHSGFAGSFFSMLSFVVSTWTLYVLIKRMTASSWAAWIGAAAFALNLNMLYLQSTALTEPLFLVFFIVSVLVFYLWMENEDPKYVALLGILGLFQMLTRYDGWFVVAVEAALIFCFGYFFRKQKITNVIGNVIVFSFPIVFGVGLWLGWNYLIFKDPLYFIFGPYSAHSQQAYINLNAGLVSKGNLGNSVLAYWYVVRANIGMLILGVSSLGAAVLFLRKLRPTPFTGKVLLLILLLSPILFNILSLYLGFSIISMPELHGGASGNLSDQWFNVRYGILALPMAAFLVGILASYKKVLAYILLLIIVWQGALFATKDGIITIVDGTRGSSSFANQDIADGLQKVVKDDEKILLAMSFFNPVAFKSGFDLSQFIHEGVSKSWDNALKHPEEYAKYIVMSGGDVGDPIYTALVKNGKNAFLKNYILAFQGQHANIYRLRDKNELFVTQSGKNIQLGKDSYIVRGVNSFDLAYRGKGDIERTFFLLNQAGVNTVRFWMFGDGFEEGFQPRAGIISEERFKNVDYIITSAEKYDIKLIPTLVNNWNDYGGKEQYLTWTGNPKDEVDQFYLDRRTIDLFKNYINKVVSRVNSLTNKRYSDTTAILAWDIMNEPRVSQENQGAFLGWSKEIVDFIHSKDSEHLVFIGTEKLSTDGELGKKVCEIAGVDMCSVHLYFEDKGVPLFSNLDGVKSFLQEQKAIASSLNKPLMIGEIGTRKNVTLFDLPPFEMLKQTVEFLEGKNANGYLIWNWSIKADDSFGFSEFGTNKYDFDGLSDILKGTHKQAVP